MVADYYCGLETHYAVVTTFWSCWKCTQGTASDYLSEGDIIRFECGENSLTPVLFEYFGEFPQLLLKTIVSLINAHWFVAVFTAGGRLNRSVLDIAASARRSPELSLLFRCENLLSSLTALYYDAESLFSLSFWFVLWIIMTLSIFCTGLAIMLSIK